MTYKKASRAMWLEEALNLLEEKGEAALTIERLCRKMRKTKGGFYHHFGDAEGLRKAILDHWEAAHTSALIDATELAAAEQKKAVLDKMANAANWGHERAIRRWAWADKRVRKRVAKVDERRIAYLTQFYPKASLERQRALATLEYAALVGAQHLFGFGDAPRGEESLALGALLREALDRLQGEVNGE
ncbi:MAG: AcrR family transcriptional regulator [Polyangiales bacterium]